MQVHNRRDLIAGAGVTIVGAVYFADTFRIKATDDPVGPETLPQIVGIALIVLGVFIAATAFRAKPQGDIEASMLAAAGAPSRVTAPAEAGAGSAEAGTGSAEAGAGVVTEVPGTSGAGVAADEAPVGEGTFPDAPEDPPVQLSKLAVYLGLFAAYALLLIPLGFLVATTAFLLALTSIYNRGAWVRNILYSVLFSVIIYFSFKEGLGVFLPAGLIG